MARMRHRPSISQEISYLRPVILPHLVLVLPLAALFCGAQIPSCKTHGTDLTHPLLASETQYRAMLT